MVKKPQFYKYLIPNETGNQEMTTTGKDLNTANAESYNNILLFKINCALVIFMSVLSLKSKRLRKNKNHKMIA
jgi:hypothetical protein